MAKKQIDSSVKTSMRGIKSKRYQGRWREGERDAMDGLRVAAARSVCALLLLLRVQISYPLSTEEGGRGWQGAETLQTSVDSDLTQWNAGVNEVISQEHHRTYVGCLVLC